MQSKQGHFGSTQTKEKGKNLKISQRKRGTMIKVRVDLKLRVHSSEVSVELGRICYLNK